MREAAKPALEKLDELGIKYYYYEHPLAKTMEDCEGIGADVGAKHFKNIYACDHTETNFFIIIIRADKKFRTSEVSRKLGVSRLSFCTDEMLRGKPRRSFRRRHPSCPDERQGAQDPSGSGQGYPPGRNGMLPSPDQRRYRGHAPLRSDQVRPGLRQRDKVPRHRRRRAY